MSGPGGSSRGLWACPAPRTGMDKPSSLPVKGSLETSGSSEVREQRGAREQGLLEPATMSSTEAGEGALVSTILPL